MASHIRRRDSSSSSYTVSSASSVTSSASSASSSYSSSVSSLSASTSSIINIGTNERDSFAILRCSLEADAPDVACSSSRTSQRGYDAEIVESLSDDNAEHGFSNGRRLQFSNSRNEIDELTGKDHEMLKVVAQLMQTNDVTTAAETSTVTQTSSKVHSELSDKNQVLGSDIVLDKEPSSDRYTPRPSTHLEVVQLIPVSKVRARSSSSSEGFRDSEFVTPRSSGRGSRTRFVRVKRNTLEKMDSPPLLPSISPSSTESYLYYSESDAPCSTQPSIEDQAMHHHRHIDTNVTHLNHIVNPHATSAVGFGTMASKSVTTGKTACMHPKSMETCDSNIVPSVELDTEEHVDLYKQKINWSFSKFLPLYPSAKAGQPDNSAAPENNTFPHQFDRYFHLYSKTRNTVPTVDEWNTYLRWRVADGQVLKKKTVVTKRTTVIETSTLDRKTALVATNA